MRKALSTFGSGNTMRHWHWFDQVIAARPDAYSAYILRAEFKRMAGRPVLARADYDQAVGLQDIPMHHLLRGVYLAGRGELSEAERDYQLVREQTKVDLEFLRNRVTLALQLRHFDEAIADAQAFLQRVPHDPWRVIWLYQARRWLSYSQALDELKEHAAQLDLDKWPGPIIQYLLGDIDADRLRAVTASTISSDWMDDPTCSVEFFVLQNQLLEQGHSPQLEQRLRQLSNSCKGLMFEGALAGAQAKWPAGQ